MVGASLTVIVISSKLSAQTPLEIVHLNTLSPIPKAVTPELKALTSVIVPVPDTNVQVPVPTAGSLPAKVAVPGASQIS